MTARLWEVATGKEIATLRGHTGGVKAVAFNPDGRTLATGSDDGFGALWDVSTRRLVAGLPHIRGQPPAAVDVLSVAFSPDGRTLATGSYDKSARLWPIGQGLIDFACARVHHLPLSENDKDRFGIVSEWCTPEVSAALRAKLGMDGPNAAPPLGTAAH